MTSPSAQKAASKIDDFIEHHNGFSGRMAPIAEIVQQAITEAVDAAVGQEKAKYLKLAADWREKYPGGHFIVKGAVVETLATELESLVKEK